MYARKEIQERQRLWILESVVAQGFGDIKRKAGFREVVR